jgi:hypothetical protein
MLRPDFSTGHLSRSWNQSIINGFQNLKNPKCDIVITNQDDTLFKINYLNKIVTLHKEYDFVQLGRGDNYISYTPNAIKCIGLWDERFCNIGFQEADYFLRVKKFLKKHTINDIAHGRTSNQIENKIIENYISIDNNKIREHSRSACFHNISKKMFLLKWNVNPEFWNENIYNTQQLCDNYFLYPYFEKDIQTLKEQRYIQLN